MNSPQHIMGDTIITPEAYVQLTPPFLCLPTVGDRVFSSSLEDAMPKESPSLSPNPLGSSGGPRVEFYNNFKREADECDRQFVKRYDVDLNITLVPVGVLFLPTSVLALTTLLEKRPLCYLRSHPLLLSTFNASSSQITKK